MVRQFSYIEQEEVINNAYITIEQVKMLIPPCEKTIRQKLKELREKLDSDGIDYFKTRPMYLPTKWVLQWFKLSADDIRKEANKMRKAS